MRSTQSIVQGRRWRRKKQPPDALPPEFLDRTARQASTEESEPDGQPEAPKPEGAAALEQPQKQKRNRLRFSEELRKSLPIGFCSAAVSVCLICTICYFYEHSQTDAKNVSESVVQAVTLGQGECLVTVPVSGMADVLSTGDVVSLCSPEGVIPALRYVEVAQVTRDAVGVLLDERQLDACLAASGSLTLALRAKAGDDAAALLQFQQDYNSPDVALAFSEDTLALGVGQTVIAPVQLTVKPKEAAPNAITWRSSDPEIVSVDADGTLTGVAVGEAEVTAEALGVTAALHVSVSVLAENIQISKEEATLLVGRTGGLSVVLTPENVTDGTVQWRSDNEAVATVKPTGDLTATVTAVSDGVAEITASCGGAADVCRITVCTPADSISLSKAALGLTVGAAEQLAVTILPEAASGRPVQWVSSDPAVATVSEDGTVAAVKAGTAAITAACDGLTAVCTVTVK